MKITKVTDRHTIFTVPENAHYDLNLGLILGKKHNFIIDTGMGGSNVQAMLEYLKQTGSDTKPVIAINTHYHEDHILGNWILEDKLIISHVLCSELINKNWDGSMKEDIENSREYFDDEIHKCLPNMLFDKVLLFPEDGITLFHSPGHTADCISVYDAVDKVLYVGDNFGIFDGAAAVWIGPWDAVAQRNVIDVDALQRLINIYKQYDFKICISGHSPPYTGNVITLLETALKEAKSGENYGR